MTGQCQVKGQKSSERFIVDESEQAERRADHTPKGIHAPILSIKMQPNFNSLAYTRAGDGLCRHHSDQAGGAI